MVAAVAAFVLLATSCVTGDAVTKFASQSSQSLSQGQPILKDIEGSCIRQHLAEQAVPSDVNQVLNPDAFKQAADDPACKAYAEVQPGELAILKTLTDYFNAISALASNGASGVKGEADTTKLKKSGEADNVIKATSSLSVFLGKVATDSYQAKHLSNDIKSTDADVAVVVDALIEIVQQRYVGNQLVNEEHGITESYKDLLRQGPSPASSVLLRSQWEQEITAIGDRKSAADAWVKCLEQIKEGHHKLATEADKLNPQQAAALIQPYTDSLKSLLPTLQKLR